MTNRVDTERTDAGGRAVDAAHVLHRIADALDIPVADFYRADPAVEESDVPSARECEAMLATFVQIQDIETRRRIAALMRAYADA